MASIYEKEPLFYLERTWMETFSKFENVLAGSYKTAWREVVKDHFTPLPAEASKDELKKSFFEAITRFICAILDSDTPRDKQYVYMAPGGDHRIAMDLLTPLRKHARHYKEMLRITEQLPPGKEQPPSKKLALQWYYMTYHRSDCTEYVKSRKKLSAETIKSLMEYFQALFAQKKADGSLERAELDLIRQRAKRTLTSSLCEQRDARRTSHERGELRERGQRGGSRSYCRGDDDGGDSRGERDRHRQQGAQSAHGRDGCHGRDGRGGSNNQPSGGRGASGGDHGRCRGGNDHRADAPKKTWDLREYRRRDGKSGPNPHRNRAGLVPDDAHMIDPRYPSMSDRESDDKHDSVASKGEASSCDGDDRDDDEDNLAVAMAPPAKRAKKSAGGAVPRKMRKVIESDDDEDNAIDDDDALLAEMGELLKGNDPLAFD
jgi:hypothetical protein